MINNTFIEFINLFPNGVILTDKKTVIMYANDVAHSIFGFEKDELLGLPVNKLIPRKLHAKHKEHTTKYAKCPAKMNMSNRSGLLGQRKDNTTFPVDVSLAPVDGENGQLFMAIVRDLSKKEHIQKLELKNKQLEEFTRIAAHDLQEPLKTILSLSQILEYKNNPNLDEHTKKTLEYIDYSAGRMSELIKSLLDYSKLNSEKELETIDCSEVVQAIKQDLSKTISDTRTNIEVDALPTILGYKTEFRLLLQNLISNAIKYTKKGENPQIKISYFEENNNHIFKIKDNGIGIAEENQEKIFNVFVTLNDRNEYDGTGIGLAHCRKIAEIHKGELLIESKLGEGSCFIFKIEKT